MCLYADGNDPIEREELLECSPCVSEKGWNLVCEYVSVCGSMCVCAGRGLLRSTDSSSLVTGSEVEDRGTGADRWVCSSGGLRLI